jgi:hypothetical protein
MKTTTNTEKTRNDKKFKLVWLFSLATLLIAIAIAIPVSASRQKELKARQELEYLQERHVEAHRMLKSIVEHEDYGEYHQITHTNNRLYLKDLGEFSTELTAEPNWVGEFYDYLPTNVPMCGDYAIAILVREHPERFSEETLHELWALGDVFYDNNTGYSPSQMKTMHDAIFERCKNILIEET